jgi:hypothetical protein
MTVVYIVIAVGLLALLFVVPTLLLFMHGDEQFELGGSWGKQIFGRYKNREANNS